jgi:hypothetical protein
MKTTAQRLQAARKSAADWLAKHPAATHYHDWRNNVRRPFKKQPNACTWQRDYTGPKANRPYLIDSLSATGWRETGDAADILRNAGGWRAADECNWYADNDQDAVIKSAVLQLPAREGLARYIPATYCTDWDGATCYPLDWYATLEEVMSGTPAKAQDPTCRPTAPCKH